MKNLKLSILAASALALTACSSEDPAVNGSNGYQDGEVVFTVEMPASMSTRAVSDGLKANDLHYVVFDGATDTPLFYRKVSNAFNGTKQANVKIPLVNGKTYNVAFVAMNQNAPYSIDQTTGVLKMNYSTTDLANDDERDAFYKLHNVTVAADMDQQEVVLTRPFAQVNVGAMDWEDARLAGYVVEKTTLTFTEDVYPELNLLDGSAQGTPQVVEYDLNLLPDATVAGGKVTAASKLNVAGKPYDYMAMAYILMPEASQTVGTINFKYEGPNKTFTIPVNTVPVQRNHRTNIVGKFFTTDVDYKIIIDEQFDDDDIDLVIANTPEEVTAAASVAGTPVALPAEDIEVSADMPIATGVSLSGQGASVTTLKVDPVNDHGLVITNPNVQFNDLTLEVGELPYKSWTCAINVESDGCEINDCVVSGGGDHTYASSVLIEKLKEGESFKITGSEVKGSFRGIFAESQQGDIYVDNCVLQPQCYTINVDGGGNFGLYVTNTTLKGWTSFSNMTKGAHFTNCKFMKNTLPGSYGYNTFRSYCETTLTDCEFDADFVYYASNANAGYTIYINNCTIGGVKVTAENLKSLLVTDPDPDMWNKCVCIVDGVTVGHD